MDETYTEVVRLSHQYPYWGYRKIFDLMDQDRFEIGRDGVRLIRRRDGLQVVRKRRKKRVLGRSTHWVHRARHPNHVWSYDFVPSDPGLASDRLERITSNHEVLGRIPTARVSTRSSERPAWIVGRSSRSPSHERSSAIGSRSTTRSGRTDRSTENRRPNSSKSGPARREIQRCNRNEIPNPQNGPESWA